MDADAVTDAPTPLTRNERIAAWLLAIVVAGSRWPAVSRTLWDWDEALFALALRDYDVVAHHPHPPGFPLFIALAKAIASLTSLDAFHALQCVAVLSSLFLFPAMFFLARELRLRPFAALAASLLLAFFPNVWFYGGTAFSDVPSLVLALLAAALLLRGRRSDGALLAGAVVLGIAAGFRPQNLLIGFVPLLLAFRHRRRTAIAGAAIVAAIIVASYAIAASLSGGWDAYRTALATHEQYIRSVDSFLSATRPGLIQVADDFFFRPYRAPVVNVVVLLLALLGLWKTRREPLPLLIFGPFLLFAWLYLDFNSSSRFSIGYMPLFALLAASGIPSRGRTITLAATVALLIVWTAPALRIVHTTVAPPVAALEHARTLRKTIYVDERLAAHAALLLRADEYRVVHVAPPLVEDPDAVLVREGASAVPGARNLLRERDRLDGIARKRYFEVSVVPNWRP
jgi:4-amino-4-deoxy-L-arabinose transferase-like glycosyltransferase